MIRVFDILIATTALIIALPILLLTSFGIWLDDRGPVFMREERRRRDGRFVTPLRGLKKNRQGTANPIGALAESN